MRPLSLPNARTLPKTLDLAMQDLSMSQIEKVCQATAKRVTSCRYVDGPEIKTLIQERKALRGQPARRKAKEIADARKRAKHEYLCQLLEKGAAGGLQGSYVLSKTQFGCFRTGLLLHARRWNRSSSL